MTELSSIWSARLARFVLRCENTASDAGGMVRQFAELVATAPPAVSRMLAPSPPIDFVEAQLAVGAFDSAAFALVGGQAGFMVSRGPAGTAIASAWIPGEGEEHTVRAFATSVALCGAVAMACLAALTLEREQVSYPIG